MKLDRNKDKTKAQAHEPFFVPLVLDSANFPGKARG